MKRAVRQGHPNVKALYDQPTSTDLGASFGGVAGGVVDVSGRYIDIDSSRENEYVDAHGKINMFENTLVIGPSHPYTGPSPPYTGLSHLYSSPSHPYSPLCSHCKCKECKDRQDKLFEKVEVITKDVEELKFERGVIPSKKMRESYTPIVIVGGRKEQLANAKEKRDLRWAKNAKKGAQDYPMHTFFAQDFKSMIDMRTQYVGKYVEEILWLIRGRQLAYSKAYDAINRIMNLNFYKNFKDRYNHLTKLASTLDGLGFDSLVSGFQWDEEMIKYVSAERPYPHGKS
ncbi:hypothetical protein FXO38_01233 [Capsicum annuum]|nr:hypothetical protein FXO38_01233 [Capsicum annuum]